LTFSVLHDSVATQLRRVGMFSNQTTATCPQSVPVKEFLKSVNIWRRYVCIMGRFLGHSA